MNRNITLNADEFLIKKARELALEDHTSLNQLFRDWLERYTEARNSVVEYRKLMRGLDHVQPGRKFTRDEMNER